MGIFRFILAFVVILHHMPGIPEKFRLLGGAKAVETFYLISGFYMALVLDKKYRFCSQTYKTFIYSRFLRIYPQYILVLVITAASYFILLSIFPTLSHTPYLNFFDDYTTTLKMFSFWDMVIAVATSLSIFGQDFLAYFSPTKYHAIYPVVIAWSLACELTFYLTAPIIFRFKQRSLVYLFVLFIIIRIISLFVFGSDFVYRLPITQYPLFLLGFIVYSFGDIKLSKPLLFSALIVFFAFLLFGNMAVSHTLSLKLRIITAEHVSVGRWGNVFYWIFYSSVALLLWKIHKLDFGKIDKFLGNLSFPFYLTHLVVINILTLFLFHSVWIRLCFAAVISIVISILLELFVQRRVDRFRASIVRNAIS